MEIVLNIPSILHVSCSTCVAPSNT